MANTIKLKRGTSTPSTSDISSGEVAIDTSAQKLYINDSGTVKEIGGSTDLTSVSTNIVPDADSSRTLGTEQKAWQRIWSDEVRVLGNGRLQFVGAYVGMYSANSHFEIKQTQQTKEIRFLTANGGIYLKENSGDLMPLTDSSTDIGSDALRFQNIYADTLYGDGSNLTNVSASDSTKLPLAGGTLTGNVRYNDSVEAQFGSSGDFRIYHDGSSGTYLKEDSGTGHLNIGGSQVIIQNADMNEVCAKFIADGATELYYNNAKKAETVSGGFTVTGTCTATAFSGDGSSLTNISASDSTKLPLAGGTLTGNTKLNDNIQLQFGSDTDYFIKHDGSNCWHKCTTGNLELKTYGTNAGNLNFESAGSSTFKVDENTTALTLASNGNATFGGTVTASTKFDGSLFENNDGNVVVRAGHPYHTITYKGYTHTFTKPTDGETQAKFQADGGCELYYDDSKKFETVTGGATITGTCTATAFSGDGSALTGISVAGTGETYVKLYTNGNLNNSGSNTVAGYNAGVALESGSAENTFYGQEAGKGLTTGDNNTLIGAICGETITTGGNNTGVGQDCLRALSTGSNNTAVGKDAFKGGSGCTASSNTAIGYRALAAGTTGSYNIAVGSGCLDALTTATSTTALGTDAGGAVTTSGESVIIGAQCGTSLTTGSSNTLIGAYAGRAVTTGTSNVCVGQDSFRYGTGGSNTCIGGAAGDISNFTGSNNLILGYGADPSAADVSNEITLGDANITLFRVPGVGFHVRDTNSTTNLSIGNAAAGAAMASDHSTIVGYNAGTGACGGNSTFFGSNAGNAVTGSDNTAIGQEALKTCTSGTDNTSVGRRSLQDCTTGPQNTAVGKLALKSVTTAKENTGHGYEAGSAVTTGDSNTILGFKAGDALTTGDNNIIIGANSAASAVGVDNEITLGDAGITKFRVPGLNFSIKDSTATDNYVLTVDANGDAGWEAAAGGGVTSDSQGNTLGGTNAGDSFSGTDAIKNTLFGYDAGTAITTGDKNAAFGHSAGKSLTNSEDNCAFGFDALRDNTTGNGNTAIGMNALEEMSGGWANTSVGQNSLSSTQNCTGNVAVGYNAGSNVNTGDYNTSLGFQALRSQFNAPTSYSVGVGFEAMQIASGTANVGVGSYAGHDVTTGTDNTCIGPNAGDKLTTGANNLILGHDAAASAVTVSNEITLGDTNITKFRIPGLNFSIKDSTATDNYVLTVDANGDAGWEAAAGGLTTDSNSNVVGGTGAGANIGGSATSNTLIGKNAGTSITTGMYNTGIGDNAIKAATSGSNNIAIGQNSFKVSSGDSNCIAIGNNSLKAMTGSGSANNTAVGMGNVAKLTTTGTNNSYFGYYAGNNLTTGSNCSFLGANATASSATVSNEITLGDTNITKLRVPGIGLEATDNGISTDGVFIENGQTVTADYTITDGKNAGSFGPITINSGITVTIGTGENWTVV